MTFLLFTSLEAARAADLMAFELLQMTQNSGGSEWSGVYTNHQGLWAILYDPCIAAAFTEAELLEVIEGELLTRENGQFSGGDWEPVK